MPVDLQTAIDKGDNIFSPIPIAQRSGASQATSAIGTASSGDVTTALKAAVIEIMDTLVALKVWKGSA